MQDKKRLYLGAVCFFLLMTWVLNVVAFGTPWLTIAISSSRRLAAGDTHVLASAESRQLQPCSVSNCNQCPYSSSSCIACASGFALVPVSSSTYGCTPITPAITSQSYGLTTGSVNGGAPKAYTVGTAASVTLGLGAAALALHVLAFLAGLAAFCAAGIDLALHLGLPIPLPLQGVSAAGRRTMIAAWVSFVCTALGLALGLAFLGTAFSNVFSVQPTPGLKVSFPGRDCASAAIVFALVAAVLQTVYLGQCCCCGGGKGASALSTSAPVITVVSPHAAATAAPAPAAGAAASQWTEEMDGADKYYVNCKTGESAWDLPPGGVVVKA